MHSSPYYKLQDAGKAFTSESEVNKFIKGLLLKDFKIYEIQQRLGELIPYHTHQHKEMILMLDGYMRMIIEEDIVNLKRGDLLTIEAWSIHLACFPLEGGAKFYLCSPRNR